MGAVRRAHFAEELERRLMLSSVPAWFGAAQTYGIGVNSSSATTADLNNDGKIDVVAANRTPGTIRVLLGNGNGTLGVQRTFGTDPYPASVATADLNGDGRADVITANWTSNTLSVLLGNGDGTFGSQLTLATDGRPSFVAAADLNEDGRTDLLAANTVGANVGVFLGKGDGTFAAQQTIGTASSTNVVKVADLNGDGKPDLVAVNVYDNILATLLGNGNGTFKPGRTFALSWGFVPTSLSIADVNGDGKPDLITANYQSDNVSVLLGIGNDDFQAQRTYAVGWGPFSVTVSDVNLDGLPDLVTANTAGASVTVLTGNGDGTFAPAWAFPAYLRPKTLDVVDLNQDGRPDLVILNDLNAGTVSVLQADVPPVVESIGRTTPVGPDTTAMSVTYTVNFSKPVTGVDAGDFRVVRLGSVITSLPVVVTPVISSVYTVTVNGIHGNGGIELDLIDNDSIHDGAGAPLGGPGVANGSFLGPQYEILQAGPRVVSINRALPIGQTTDGTSGVYFTVTFSSPVVGVDASDFAVVKGGTVSVLGPISISGSGAVYVVGVNGISGSGTLGLNLVDNGSIHDLNGNPLGSMGAASFQGQQTFAVGSVALALAVSDVNGDGIADTLTANSGANSVSVLLGNGNGTFKGQMTFAVGPSPFSMSVGDVNGDGYPDVLTANENNDTVTVLLGNGNGTFGSRQDLPVGHEPTYVAMADLNGDGRIDLAVANFYSHGIGVLLGNGDGTFGTMKTFRAGASPFAIAVGDLNGDGRADLAVSNQYDGTVSVLLGNNDGSFQTQQTLEAGAGAGSVSISDLNGDGRADMAVGDFNAGMISVFIGNGNGTFHEQQTFASGVHPLKLVASDVNGDGIRDVLVTNQYGDTVSVLKGLGDGTFGSPQSLATGILASGLGVTDADGDGRADIIAASAVSQQVGVFLANRIGSFTGETYAIVLNSNNVVGTGGSDQITLTMDPDHIHIDWSVGTTMGWTLWDNLNGLTVNSAGGNDVITIDYSNGNPLPNVFHLNGTFTINGLRGAAPLAGTNLEMGKSTVWISYSGTSPASMILAALAAGYNGGAWNGTSAGGVITSSAPAGNGNHNTGIGWADSADGTGVNAVPNSVELKYTLVGDVNLDGAVNITDVNALVPHYNSTGSWTGGDFNYDGLVNITDVNALVPNYNTSLGSQVMGTVATLAPAVAGGDVTAEAVNAAGLAASSNVAGGSGSVGGVSSNAGMNGNLKRKKFDKGLRGR